MSKIIEVLLREHQNIEKLLLVLEEELKAFDHGEPPDYEILQTIVEYFQDYPEHYHHPKEDIVFDKLKVRDPALARRIGNVKAEHQTEGNRLREFARAVEDILAGREFLRQTFHDLARDLIAHQREHMDKEERLLFPAAVKALRQADWAEIDKRMNNGTDPLFDRTVEKKFDALRRTVLRWEQETQANRAQN